MVRTPSLVASVSMLYLRSPSTSGKSFVIAITVANTVTKEVTKLQQQWTAAHNLQLNDRHASHTQTSMQWYRLYSARWVGMATSQDGKPAGRSTVVIAADQQRADKGCDCHMNTKLARWWLQANNSVLLITRP